MKGIWSETGNWSLDYENMRIERRMGPIYLRKAFNPSREEFDEVPGAAGHKITYVDGQVVEIEEFYDRAFGESISLPGNPP